MSLTELVTDLETISQRLLAEAHNHREDSLNFANAHLVDARNLIAAVARRREPQLQGRDREETDLKARIAQLEAQLDRERPVYVEPPPLTPEMRERAIEAREKLETAPESLTAQAPEGPPLIPGPEIELPVDPEQLARDQARNDSMAASEAKRHGDPAEPGWG